MKCARLSPELSTYADDRLISRSACEAKLASTPLPGEGTHVRADHRPEGAAPSSLGLAWTIEGWSRAAFVFLPAGAYAGNRFPSLKIPYSPRVPAELVAGAATPPYITDVPRLSDGPGDSRLQLKSGDLAFPAFGWFDPEGREAWFAMADDPSVAADWLFEIEESADRAEAVFRVVTPGVRQSPVYRLPMMQAPSPDRGAMPAPGLNLALDVRVYRWECADLTAFFDRVFTLRTGYATAARDVPAVLPFSAATGLIEEHYRRDSWRESLGVFASDCGPAARLTFQLGWCGGMIATFPLLASSDETTGELALRNLETFFANAPLASGFFNGRCDRDGRWMLDFLYDDTRPYTHRWALIRRQTDALWFILRQVDFLEKKRAGWRTPAAWDEALRACAGALVALWRRGERFGHFIDPIEGRVLVGGSASAGLAPAALVAAWRRYGDERFLEVAKESAAFFAQEHVARGLTTGGPADAMQNPDSESVAALVESFAALDAVLGGERWREHGRAAAALLATWVMPYDFPFPSGTEFHRLDVRTRGSVFANTQNKHSAPGLCTHAGAGLLHLFRSTGDTRLMDLLRDIARFIPQVVSRADRPVHAKDGRAMPSGWINERVNTSDWDDNVGGVFHGSCWCEVSMLLTAHELPGVYVRTDLRRVWCLDHVRAVFTAEGALRIENPTAFPASVRLLVEDDEAAARPLDACWFADARRVALAPGASVDLPLFGERVPLSLTASVAGSLLV